MSQIEQKEPWYKNPFMTVFVVGLPVLVVVVCIFFIIYSIKIQDSTVRDDWYMDGKTLYQDASRDQLAYDLGVSGVMRFDGDDVRFELRYPSNAPLNPNVLDYPKTLTVSISHATDNAQDQDFELQHTQDGVYVGKLTKTPIPAKYYLQVANTGKQDWRLIQPQKLPAKNVPFAPLDSFEHEQQNLPDQRNKRANLTEKTS